VRARGEPQVRWSPEFLADLARRTLLRYLAVAHAGRGRGPFEEEQPLERWRSAIERAVEARSALTRRLRETSSETAGLAHELASDVRAILVDVLVQDHPGARALLRAQG